MTLHQLRKLGYLLILLAVLSGCNQESLSFPEESTKYTYQEPPAKNDGWQVGHLTDYQIDENRISQMMNEILGGIHPGIDSISIVKNRTLVLHQNLRTELNQYDHWVGNQDIERHVMHSTSKSFVSALVGMVFDQGLLTDTSEPFYRLFDYYDYANWSLDKDKMTLEDVLTMRLGLEWDEWTYPFGDERNSLTQLSEENNDFVKALLDLPLESQPGGNYTYNTVASIALGQLVEKISGMPLEDFAQVYLFDPMQIDQADWLMTPSDTPDTGSGLFLKTRDMAKFGQLYLDKGRWNGMQLISENWVERSLNRHVELTGEYTSGYGYQWWLGEFIVDNKPMPFYSTRGYGGQFIIIVPHYDLVVAFTAQNYDNGLYELPFELIEQYILPALAVETA